MQREYWRSRLKTKEQTLYDQLMGEFYKFKENVQCSYYSAKSLNKVYVSILNDHPEMYYLPTQLKMTQAFSVLGAKTELKLSNIFSQCQINRYDTIINSIKQQLSNSISMREDVIQIEKSLCAYIVKNTTYRINNIFNQNAATVLVEKQGQCSGISKAAKMLFNWFGIDAIVVNGKAKDNKTGKMESHAWNIVNINGNFYHVDVTFMLGANPNKEHINYAYLNYADDEIKNTHIWDSSTVPSCTTHFDDITQQNCSQDYSVSDELTVYSIKQIYDLIVLAIRNGKSNVIFESSMPLQQSELLRIVQESCQNIIKDYKINIKMTITINTNIVQIKW